MTTRTIFPFDYIADPDKGRPLFQAKLYFGEADKNPKQFPRQAFAIQEDGTEIPLPSSINTPAIFTGSGGVPEYNGLPVRIAIDGNYSFLVEDRLGVQKYFVEDALQGDPVLQSIARSLNILDSDIIYDTDLLTPIPRYIYSASQQVTYEVPDAALGEMIISVVGAVLTTNMGVYYLLNPLPVSTSTTLEKFGGIADAYNSDGTLNGSRTDNTPALLRLIEEVSTIQKSITYGDIKSAGKILLNPGGYYFSEPISLKVQLIIEGSTSGLFGGWASSLVFDGDQGTLGGCAGVTFHRADTDSTTDSQVASTFGGDGSILRNLRIVAINNVPEVTDEIDQRNQGVWYRARAVLDNVIIENFGSHGFMVQAVQASGEGAHGNANLWEANTVFSVSCGYHGAYIIGGDSNAGSSYKFNAIACNGNGIKDSSFLGNTHTASHISLCYRDEHYSTHLGNTWWCQNPALANATEPGTDDEVWFDNGASLPSKPWSGSDTYELAGAVTTTNANSNCVFIGLYTEVGNQGPVYLLQRDALIGGLVSVGFSPQTILADNHIVSRGRSVAPKFRSEGLDDGEQRIEFLSRNGILAQYKGPDSLISNNPRLAIGNTATGDTTLIGFGHADYPSVGLCLTNAPTSVDGLAKGDWSCESGVMLGTRELSLRRGAILTGQFYKRGSIIFQTPNALAQSSYLQCITAGLGNSTAVFESHVL